MSSEEHIQRVRIYITEQDRWEQQPLYLAVMERLQREGATGATALQGVGGFGPGHRMRAPGMGDIGGSSPIVIEWIDRVERVAQILPLFDDMLPNALITLEHVGVHRAILRSQGLFGAEKNVGNIMRPSPQTVTRSATLGRVITLMLASNQSMVPVVDEGNTIVGVVTELDIARRAGLRLPLRLIPLLTKEEGNNLIAPIAGRQVSDVMNHEWRSVHDNAFIPQALVLMIEWSYDQIPVVDRSDALIGLVSWTDVLSCVLEQSKQGDESHQDSVRSADQPTPISLVMQHMVHQVPITQRLGFTMQQLLETPDRYLVVVDETGHVQGHISDTGVFQRLGPTERAPLLTAIQQGKAVRAADFPGANRTIDAVIDRETPTLLPRDTIVDAIQRLMEMNTERAAVVDEDGKLQGMIARGSLLRALIQESH